MDTPIPGISKNGSIRITLSMLGGVIVIMGGIVTHYVYATKGELAEQAKTEAANSAELDKRTTLNESAIVRLEGYVQAINTNMRTMLLEVNVPERRIAKPKVKP